MAELPRHYCRNYFFFREFFFDSFFPPYVRQEVPEILYSLGKSVQEISKQSEGVFRKEPSAADVKQLQQELELVAKNAVNRCAEYDKILSSFDKVYRTNLKSIIN